MSKFTPGPWHVTSVQGGWDGVVDDHNAIICTLKLNEPKNADLIAAAPDLLTELRDFHNHVIDMGNHDCEGIPGGCPVLKAIAKAEGKA